MEIDNRYDEEDIDGATSFQKGGDNHLYTIKSYTKQPTVGQSTKTRTVKWTSEVIPTSRQAHREAIYRDWHWEVDRDVYAEVDQDSTKVASQERNHEVDWKVTETDNRRRLPSQAASTSEYHIPMTTDWERYSREHGMKARQSASTLELGKYSLFREASLLEVNEWDGTAHDANDVYDWWLQRMAAAKAPVNAGSRAEA